MFVHGYDDDEVTIVYDIGRFFGKNHFSLAQYFIF